ncbi:MAG: Hsp20/alpha crystallin family protein [Chloroflexi bacterium]|jgi:HSP20 family protein|nr:Hsp20/alpha crystallin family protein [Chloroflexota bacterium]
MSSLRRYDPSLVEGADRGWLGRPLADSLRAQLATMGPSLDVYETESGLVVQMSLPGVSPEDVDITVTGDTLTIRGEIKPDEGETDRDYLLRERAHGTGRFSRSLTLPRDVDGPAGEASFQHGVLTLTLPRTEASRPRQVPIKSA